MCYLSQAFLNAALSNVENNKFSNSEFFKLTFNGESLNVLMTAEKLIDPSYELLQLAGAERHLPNEAAYSVM